MSQAFVRRNQLIGLADAFRFARIPLFCAALVALVSADPIGRTIAIVLGTVVVVTGVALNAPQIFLGRQGRRLTVAPTTYETRRAA